MIDSTQASSIKMLSLKGKALASVLGTHTDLEACDADELALSFYTLEGIFTEILDRVGGDTVGLEQQDGQARTPGAVPCPPSAGL